MPDRPEIIREDRPDGGRYVMYLPDGSEAQMTFRIRGTDTLVIDHTIVPNQYRGHGLAAQLVERGISDARTSNKKIVPQCSYVAAQFRRHPEWANLLAE